MLIAKRKPRDRPANRPSPNRQKKPDAEVKPNAPTRTSRQNLTLADWLLVYARVDAHPDDSQGKIVEHFRTRPEGALIFTQSTLSRKLGERSQMEARANDNPSALSSKRPRIVTRPDVERALVLWVRDMEQRGETVSGPILREKRRRFEELFQVPEAERLLGEGWMQSFCRTYKLREIRRHGKASSVDEAVEEEHSCCQQLLANDAPRDQFNVDETAFNPCSPPDCGLAVEDEPMDCVAHLKSWNHTFGPLPTPNEPLDPPEEVEVRDLELFSTGEEGEKEIVDAVHHEMAVVRGEIIEIDLDEEDEPQPCITRSHAMALCDQLEKAVSEYGEAEDFELVERLHRFREHLKKQQLANTKQTTLNEYFVPHTASE